MGLEAFIYLALLHKSLYLRKIINFYFQKTVPHQISLQMFQNEWTQR
jgi:hypothetical protein